MKPSAGTYEILFAPLEKEFGRFDSDTLTSIIGFSAAGPVSLRTNHSRGILVTCELVEYPDQQRSSEGINFELFTRNLDENDGSTLLTAIGDLSLREQLGDRHRIMVSSLGLQDIEMVQLRLFSQSQIENRRLGVYEVVVV
jgi:hypothetical protein